MKQPDTVVAYIHAQQSYVDDSYNFYVFGMDMSHCGYIPLTKVDIPLPKFTSEQIKARHLVLLRLERDEVYEKARKEAASLDERISKLEAIGYTPTDKEPAQ